MDFQILLSPAEDFEGDIVLALSVHLFFFLSSQPAMDYGKLTKGASWSHLPQSYHWPSGKAVSCLERSEESTGYGTQVDP